MTKELRFSDSEFEELSRYVRERTGIHLQDERKEKYQKELALESLTSGRANALDFIRNVKDSQNALQELINHITVGESYFFRNRPHFIALRNQIMPRLIEEAEEQKQLRIWSAGCAKGEEPYSIAILLRRYFPNVRDWDITIRASDINSAFIEQGEKAVYSEWSLRGLEKELIDTYFIKRLDGRYQLVPAVKSAVTFQKYNLNDLDFENLSGVRHWDLILCRNVLIYFTYDSCQRVVRAFENLLRPSGYLLVGPSEVLSSREQLDTVYSDTTYFYQRRDESIAKSQTPEHTAYQLSIPGTGRPSSFPSYLNGSSNNSDTPNTVSLPAQSDVRFPTQDASPIDESQRCVETVFDEARKHANQGDVEKAYEVLDRVIGSGSTIDYRFYFLYAMVADQLGKTLEATLALKQTIFLNKKFIIGHFYLAAIYERNGQFRLARTHYRNVCRLLDGVDNASLIDDAEGLTAGRLREITRSRLNETYV